MRPELKTRLAWFDLGARAFASRTSQPSLSFTVDGRLEAA
jgi:hypothetical protein